MAAEVWRPIPGYDGYEASDLGRIRSHRRGRTKMMKPTIKADGYHYLRCRVDGGYKHLRVNRAVLFAHVGVPPAKNHAAHEDGNKGNNLLENLSWKTKTENERDKVRHGRSNRGERCGTSKLNKELVEAIRTLAPCHGPDQIWIARMLHMSINAIYCAGTGRTWVNG